jgi:type II secretory pathway component HofQ
VLRLLADVGGVNLVIDPTVPADSKVDLKLTRVPWDQVFETVVRTSQLSYELEGSVVRVVSSTAMQREFEARQKYLAARSDAEAALSVKARIFTLNYSKGSDLEKILKSSVLSKHGDTRFDDAPTRCPRRSGPLDAAADLGSSTYRPSRRSRSKGVSSGPT